MRSRRRTGAGARWHRYDVCVAASYAVVGFVGAVGCTAATGAETILEAFERQATPNGFTLQEKGARRSPRSLEFRSDAQIASLFQGKVQRRQQTEYTVIATGAGSGGTEYVLSARESNRSMVAREQSESGEPSFAWAWTLWDSPSMAPSGPSPPTSRLTPATPTTPTTPTTPIAPTKTDREEEVAEPAPPECTQDTDCVLSCYAPGSCCPAACWCSNPVPKARAASIYQSAREACISNPEPCKQVHCGQRAYREVAFCNSDGRCDVKRDPSPSRSPAQP
ncbi:MAG: hypothetical protein AAFQ65_13115 [Myxococcota bacterium]